jgi:hypothetical protein
MKKVIIKTPVETVINPEQTSEEQIIIGYFNNECLTCCNKKCLTRCNSENCWDKLSKIYIGSGHLKYQWCNLEKTNGWSSLFVDVGFYTVVDATKAYLNDGNEVYVFDSFAQFIDEFPALVKSKEAAQ